MKKVLLLVALLIFTFFISGVVSAEKSGVVCISADELWQPVFVLDENGRLNPSDVISYMQYSNMHVTMISGSLGAYNAIQDGNWPSELRFLTDRYMPFIPTSLFDPAGKDMKIEFVKEIPEVVDPEKILILVSEENVWCCVIAEYDCENGFKWSDPDISRFLVEGNASIVFNEKRMIISLNRANTIIAGVVDSAMYAFIYVYNRLPKTHEEFFTGIRINEKFHYIPDKEFKIRIYNGIIAYTTFYKGTDPVGMMSWSPHNGWVFVKDGLNWTRGYWHPNNQTGFMYKRGMNSEKLEVPVIPPEDLYYRDIVLYWTDWNTKPW